MNRGHISLSVLSNMTSSHIRLVKLPRPSLMREKERETKVPRQPLSAFTVLQVFSDHTGH